MLERWVFFHISSTLSCPPVVLNDLSPTTCKKFSTRSAALGWKEAANKTAERNQGDFACGHQANDSSCCRAKLLSATVGENWGFRSLYALDFLAAVKSQVWLDFSSNGVKFFDKLKKKYITRCFKAYFWYFLVKLSFSKMKTLSYYFLFLKTPKIIGLIMSDFSKWPVLWKFSWNIGTTENICFASGRN